MASSTSPTLPPYNNLSTPNIVLFGECGSGKSSVVNMIAQRDTAPIGSGATGVTLDNTCYPVQFDGLDFNIYDTAGLDEADAGSVPKRQAIIQLYRLLLSLDTGVNLLVFCMRAHRIRDNTYKNWRLFHEIICGGNVPIILVITGLEQENDMDQWWIRNKGAFQKYGIHPHGVACITATRGKQISQHGNSQGYCNHTLTVCAGNSVSRVSALNEEYNDSRVKMWRQIRTHCLERAWRVPPVEWFKKIVGVTYETRWCGLLGPIEHKTFHTEAAAGLQKLVAQCEMSDKEARELGEALSEE